MKAVKLNTESLNGVQKKLNVTLNQWKEIYNKEMAYSPDLRRMERIQEAHMMILILEKDIFEAA